MKNQCYSATEQTPHPVYSRARVVVHVVQHLRPGGIECLALEMLKHSDDSVFIISLEGTYEAAVKDWPRLAEVFSSVIFLNKQPGLRPGLFKRLAHQLKKLKATVVHTHHIGPLLYGGIAARLAAVRDCIHTEHDAWHLQSVKRLWVERCLLQLIRPHLVADANLVEKNLQQARVFYPAVTIPNGIDSEHFKSSDRYSAIKQLGIARFIYPAYARALAQGKELQILGCAGRLVKEKGHQHLIDAMAELPDNVILLLAGSGPEQVEIEDRIAKENLSHRICLLGSLSDVLPFYQAIDVFVLASLNEGLPLAPLEAQACGTPVVLTDVGGCREACCPDSGLLVEAKNTAAMVWAIRRQLRSVSLFGDCKNRHNPRKFVQQHRDIRQMIAAYQQLLPG